MGFVLTAHEFVVKFRKRFPSTFWMTHGTVLLNGKHIASFNLFLSNHVEIKTDVMRHKVRHIVFGKVCDEFHHCFLRSHATRSLTNGFEIKVMETLVNLHHETRDAKRSGGPQRVKVVVGDDVRKLNESFSVAIPNQSVRFSVEETVDSWILCYRLIRCRHRQHSVTVFAVSCYSCE